MNRNSVRSEMGVLGLREWAGGSLRCDFHMGLSLELGSQGGCIYPYYLWVILTTVAEHVQGSIVRFWS